MGRHVATGRGPRVVSLLRLAGACAVAALAAVLSGCAAAPAWQFAEEPGVPIRVELKRGGTVGGELVGLEEGALLVDHSIPRSEDLQVVRRDSREIVYVSKVAVGEAVEIRDFDVVVRERFYPWEYDEAVVRSRGYVGWGTAVAAVLSFLLLQLLEEQ